MDDKRRTCARAAGKAHVTTLADLAQLVEGARLEGDCPVVDVTHDSRSVRPCFAYCALRGTRDGHDFIPDAVARGASAVVVERPVDVEIPRLIVPSVRRVIGLLAAEVHGRPSSLLDVVGITGTNGKTTTAYLLDAVLSRAEVPSALIGTIETRTGLSRTRSMLTTPQAPDLQRLLAEALAAKARAAVIEVSSHALEQHRVEGTRFKLAVFMNLTAEHLDYHGTVEQYYASKALLFEPERSDRGLVCIDDEWGRRLADQARIPVLTFGASPHADVRVELLAAELKETAVRLHHAGAAVELVAPVTGSCNAANIAAAYLASTLLGIEEDDAVQALAKAPPVPGRFELVDEGQPFLVVIDYAHTPDAVVERVRTARDLGARGATVRVVLGARGGRDRIKRQDLGRAAALADEVFLTTDSAGQEEASRIIEEVRLGMLGSPPRRLMVHPDRARSIEWAIEESAPGDVVLITGRGHEIAQHVKDRVVKLDDREVARRALKKLRLRERECVEARA